MLKTNNAAINFDSETVKRAINASSAKTSVLPMPYKYLVHPLPPAGLIFAALFGAVSAIVSEWISDLFD